MPERMTYEEFNIYGDKVERRAKTDALNVGRGVFEATTREFSVFPSLSEAALDEIARAKANEAEAVYLRKWQEGHFRDRVGLGLGARALLTIHMLPIAEERFTSDPPELYDPKVVGVEMPDGDMKTGLILPEGMYDTEWQFGSHRSETAPVWFFEQAKQGDYGLEPVTAGNHLPRYHILEISDSAGAYWTPKQ